MSKSLKSARRPLFAIVILLGVAALSGPSVPNRPMLLSRSAAAFPSEVRSLMALYGAEAASIDRGARDYKSLDQIDWKGRPGSMTQNAVVFGDPSKPGMYVQLLKRGPDDWSQPHAHPNDRYITVISGTMLIGTGAKFDKKNTVALGPGSMIRDIAGQMHYDGTGPEGLIIEIIGMGPSGRIEGGN
jgi:hypothetical protein